MAGLDSIILVVSILDCPFRKVGLCYGPGASREGSLLWDVQIGIIGGLSAY